MREVMRKKARWIRTRSVLPIQEEMMEEAKSYLDNINQEPTRRSLQLYFQNINTLKIRQGRKEIKDLFRRGVRGVHEVPERSEQEHGDGAGHGENTASDAIEHSTGAL